MKQTPCEYIVWHGLPVLRKEIVKSMVENFDLSQKEAAERLDVTPSAVSQYLSGKRGSPNITDESVIFEIDKSAERIIKEGNGVIISETCRLCKFFSSKKIFPFICEYCAEER